jgi:hypothetical protein
VLSDWVYALSCGYEECFPSRAAVFLSRSVLAARPGTGGISFFATLSSVARLSTWDSVPTLSQTMDTYSHVMPGMGDVAATALEEALS